MSTVIEPASADAERAGLLMQALFDVGVGTVAALVIGGAFLRHQLTTWMHVARAVPVAAD